MTVSLCFLCPLTSPSHPLSPIHENNVHQPGTEPGSHRWRRRILPLDHWCLWKSFGLDSCRLQIPCTPFSSSLHDTTFSRQPTPHFLALFQPPVRNPQETLGNPRKPSQLQRKPEVTPSKCPHTPFAPLQGFQPCIARFVFGRRRLDVCTVLDGGNTQPLSTLSGQDSLTRALKTSCHLELQDPLATLTTPYKSTPVGLEPTRGDPDALAARPKCPLQNLQVSCIPVQAVMSLSASASCAPLTSPSHPLSPTHENSVHQPGIEPGSDGNEIFYH